MSGDPRDRLLAARAEAQQHVASLTADLAGVAAATAGANIDDEHDPEGATVAFEREQVAALRAAAIERIAEIEAALARLDAGSYGRCERCGTSIGAARLDARPAARHCVRCARG